MKQKFKQFDFKKILAGFEEFVKAGIKTETTLTASINDIRQLTGGVGVHQILPYECYDEVTKLFYNNDNMGFCLIVIPQSGADEDMINRLNTMYSTVPANYGLQWSVLASSSFDDDLHNFIALREKTMAQGQGGDIFIQLAKQKAKFIKKNQGKPMFLGSNYAIKKTTLILSVYTKHSLDNKYKVEEIINLRESIVSNLKSAYFHSDILNPNGLVRYLWLIFNPEYMFGKELKLGDIGFDTDKLIKNQVTQLGCVMTVRGREIVFGELDGEDDSHYEINKDERICARTLSVQRYPKWKALWQMEKATGDFFNNTLQYPCPYLITAGIYFLDRNETENRVILKYTRAKDNARSPMARFQPELAEQERDWSFVHHQLDNGRSICELYHTITFFAPRNKLNQYEQVINNIWESMGFKLCSLETLQMSAFYSALPMTLNADLRSDLKRFQLISTKTTLNAVDMSPIIGEWTGLGDKVLCFFGRKGNPVFLDLYANTAGNYNLFVTGASGSGKSVLLGELINAYRGVGAKAYVIDNGRSFRNIVERQGGVFLDFDSKSNICINPFSWISGSERWENELEMLVPIYARMAAPNSSLSDYQKALLREALTITYTTYGSQGGVDEVIEVLGGMMNELGAPDAEAFRLAKQLSPYSSKAHGAYGKFFNGQANLRLDGDMVGLELEELNNFKDLRKVIVLTLIMRVTAQMYLSRKQKKIMIIDEAWDLLGNDEDAAKFIEEGYRRVRKYGGIFCVGTQGIQDAVMNKAAGAAFSNADWKFFLRPDMDKLQEVIKDSLIALDDTKIKYLESLQTEQGKYSEVLITSPNGMNIVRHIADPYSLLLSASNQADYNEVEELRNEGYNATEVLNIMAQRRGMEII